MMRPMDVYLDGFEAVPLDGPYGTPFDARTTNSDTRNRRVLIAVVASG